MFLASLKLALRNEIEATECAAARIATTPEIEPKLAFARQVGDEAKHYRLIEKRLVEMGVDLTGFDHFAQGSKSPPDLPPRAQGDRCERAAGPFYA